MLPMGNQFVPLLSPSKPAAAMSRSDSVAEHRSFKRDGDLITQIQVRCSCGESIVLDCNYAADPRNPAGRV